MEAVSASLTIEVWVECPHCSNDINLMDESHTGGYDHNEEGDVIKQACPDGAWHDKHYEFSINNVECTECSNKFNIKKLEW